MLKVAAYTGGDSVPSARFRVRQYIPALREFGVDLHEFRARWGAYPPSQKSLRPLWATATLGERALAATASFRSEVTLLQREMISTFLTVELLTRRPRVLDVDDAIFLHRGGGFARRLAARCDRVICGNAYLAEHFSQWNQDVQVLATGVDTERYQPSTRWPERPTIGWSGSSSGFPHLASITPALRTVLERHPDAVLRVVSNRRPSLEGIPADRIDFIPWTEDGEVEALHGMTAGIMPLEDTPWARGKCSFKLLTYMACGLAVVASPVGMNAEVLAIGGGLAAKSHDDWVDALESVLSGRVATARGRQAVLAEYSLAALAPRFAALLTSAGGRA